MSIERRHLEVGIVVIGRNEGERLRACLDSLIPLQVSIVYVDSASEDDSINLARSRGIDVVALDNSHPCTAARSRNAGLRRLREIVPSIPFVQFIDGDCVLHARWIDTALNRLTSDDHLAVVCGRRRERFPEASIYNRLCDMEWNTPVGEAPSCGGDAVMRIAAVDETGGYDINLIAGEEPELCLRLRRNGWRIERIDTEMTLHDARITRFAQWWKRTSRSGHAYAEAMAMHGGGPERFGVRPMMSIVLWTVVIPFVIVVLAWPTSGWSLALLMLYLIPWLRSIAGRLQRGDALPHAMVSATFCVIGKLGQLQGVIQYWLNRLRGRRTRLMEYKHVDASARLDLAEVREG